jgi:hypothetical protein
LPYKSKAQEAYFNIHRAELERKGVNVDEWNEASKGESLPERVTKVPEKVNKLRAMKKRKKG